MTPNLIQIIVRGVDQNASKTATSVRRAYQGMGSEVEKQESRLSRLNNKFVAFSGLAIGAGVATGRYTSAVGKAVEESNRYDNALTGLRTIAKYFKQDQDAATQAAKELAADGLMTVTESATGLKNLLASGFSLPQAIKLMERFKDSASFNRQAALGFGEAISGATEGIKNGNSILVDNAGVTKNLSRILEEAGYSATDLNKATSDSNIRMALYRGLLKETNPMVGDAKKLAEQFAGEQAKLASETDKTQQKIGKALQPKLKELIQTVRPIVTAVGEWVEKNPELASTLIIATGAILGTLTAIGLLGLAVSTLTTAFKVLGINSVAVATKNSVVWLAANGKIIASNVLLRGSFLLTYARASAAAATSAAASRLSWLTEIGRMKGGVRGLRSLIGKKMVMGGIAVAAALIALQKVYEAAQKARSAVGAAIDSKKANDAAGADLRRVADRQYKAGKISKKERDRLYGVSYQGNSGPSGFDRFMTGYADGGFTGRGARNEIAGVVHRGEYVVPQEHVDQQTGRPKAMGAAPQINVTNHIYNQIDQQAFLRDLGWRLRTAG